MCPICNKPADTLRSAVRDGVYISKRCDRCLASFGGFADSSRKFARDWDVREHAVDLVQPWEKEKFLKAYPDKAREYGYTDEDFRKFG
jgi:hypothetical protein